MAEAVEQHGYTQREIADHLGMHFSSISRVLRTKAKKAKKIDLPPLLLKQVLITNSFSD